MAHIPHRFPNPDQPGDVPAPEIPIPEHQDPSDPIPHQVPDTGDPGDE